MRRECGCNIASIDESCMHTEIEQKRKKISDKVEFVDKTGQPRTLDEIKEALAAVQKEFITNPLGNPNLTIHYTTIMETLALVIRLMESRK